MTASFPVLHGVAYANYYSAVQVVENKATCSDPCGPYTCPMRTFYQVSTSGGVTGAFTYSETARNGMGHCQAVSAGIMVTKQTTKSYTYSQGVGTSGYIGVNLTASTGYTSDAAINYAMGAHGHPWCGRDAYPGGQSSHLQTIHPTNI